LWTGALCNVSPSFTVSLRPTEVVRTDIKMNKDIAEMISEMGTSRNLNWLRGRKDRGYIFRNGVNGAETENFFSLPVVYVADAFVPFLEQTKAVALATISADRVKALCEAQNRVCPVGHTPVCCLRNSFPRLGKHFTADQLPKNCIVVLRGQLRSFYGMFSDHPAATAHVCVNECNRAQLKTIKLKMAGGSSATALDLVWNRIQENKFGSEVEFKEFLDTNAIEISAEDMAECLWPEDD
jgi:hypothetical protein